MGSYKYSSSHCNSIYYRSERAGWRCCACSSVMWSSLLALCKLCIVLCGGTHPIPNWIEHERLYTISLSRCEVTKQGVKKMCGGCSTQMRNPLHWDEKEVHPPLLEGNDPCVLDIVQCTRKFAVQYFPRSVWTTFLSTSFLGEKSSNRALEVPVRQPYSKIPPSACRMWLGDYR